MEYINTLNSDISNIEQVDWGNSIADSSILSNDSSSDIDTSDDVVNDVSDASGIDSTIDTDDEIDNEPIPANLFPIPGQNVLPNQPLVFDVNIDKDAQSSFLPLCLMMNARSVYNKSRNLNEMLSRIGPAVTLVSETWEREKNRLDKVLNNRQF